MGASVELPVPPAWRIVALSMRDAPALDAAAIDAALEGPVGAPPLETLAAGRHRAAIAIDDITRPTRTAPLLSRMVARLTATGLPPDAITILLATGAHAPATADDIRLKVGEVAARVRVLTHDPVRDVMDTGVTLAGHPVRVNAAFLNADLRIGIGAVMPHPFAAFSGGGKIVLPGLADLESVVRSHKYALMGFGGGLRLEGNRFRSDMEKAVRQIGLDWTVNVVLNSRCETAALTTGDLGVAHALAARRASQIGATQGPKEPLDALVINAYPKDSELLQVEAALVALRSGMLEWLKPEAPVALLGACPQGLGSHRLFGPGGRLFRKPARKSYLGHHPLHIVSPSVLADDTRAVFNEAYPYHPSWESCVASLSAVLGLAPTVGCLPCGPLHVPEGGTISQVAT
jgi:hypothetical protein